MSSDYVKNGKSTYLPDIGTGRVSISMLGSAQYILRTIKIFTSKKHAYLRYGA